MNETILRAIDAKRRLVFRYDDRPRVVEPPCYGIGTKGTELLRAHQIAGGTQREPLFDVAKIREIVLLDGHLPATGAERPARRLGDGHDLRAVVTSSMASLVGSCAVACRRQD